MEATERTRACALCPYLKTCKPAGQDADADVDPTRWLGMAAGPFALACLTTRQPCAGVASFRANLGLTELLPRMLARPVTEQAKVFASPEEFLAHHLDVPQVVAAQILESVGGLAGCVDRMVTEQADGLFADLPVAPPSEDD